ncbi:MAG: mandelate racemase/muconate lactonizing enzyme family protein [Xanthobacteraceae bacterium]
MPISITEVESYVYRVPLTSAFAWARGTMSDVTNIVTVVHGELNGASLAGIGESLPRGPDVTGDVWDGIGDVIGAVGDRLYKLELPASDPSSSVGFIAELMASLGQQIQAAATETENSKPYRGTLSGIEMALLDIAARAQALTVAELLGTRRSEVRVNARTIAANVTRAQMAERLRQNAKRFAICRLKGSGGDGVEDLGRLTTTAEICRELGLSGPLWIDINGAFAVDVARDFIEQIGRLAHEDRLSRRLIIEQPVAKQDITSLAALQSLADERAATYGGEIVIMADESVWDREDLKKFHEAGGCRAINIKIQKSGGLIEALRTAELSVAQDPDRRIYVGGIPGTGDIAARAAVAVGMALPRLDYFTAAPPSMVVHRVAEPACRFVDETSNLIAEQTGPGLGVKIDMVALRSLLHSHRRIPEEFGKSSLAAVSSARLTS